MFRSDQLNNTFVFCERIVDHRRAVLSVKEKRFFFKNIGEIPLNFYKCQPEGLDSIELIEFLSSYPPDAYPIFLLNLSTFSFGPWDFADQECFDCSKKGGTLVKPDFW